MPNIITHTLFAQEIFDKVDEATHDLFEPRLQLLEIGSNGPDFLFFHGMNPKDFYKKSDLRVAGSMFHAAHVNDFYQKALISIRNEQDEDIKKDMMTYVCGHLCHWALDAISHPYVFYRTGPCKGKSAWYHHRFESLLDAIMLKVKRECTIEDFKFYEVCDVTKEQARAIARIYVVAIRQILGFDIKPHQILESLNDWHFIETLFYDASGDKLKALQTLETFTKAYNSLSGYIVPNHPDDPYDVMNLLHTRWHHPSDSSFVSTESFFDLYDRAQLLAMEAIRLFLAACQNPDLDEDLLLLIKDRNYNLGVSNQAEMTNFDLIFESSIVKLNPIEK